MNPQTTTTARWILPQQDDDAVSRLASELGLGLPATRVLWTRGHRDAVSAKDFLSSPLASMHDPLMLKDMDRAVARLKQAIRGQEPILLYGDYDVDGTSSIVILKKTLDLLGGKADFFVPHRMRDGYGMRPEVIERAAADGVRLVISVDTGIRASAVVRHASELGIDVIVTDHHLPEAQLPPAVAVINPNRPDCTYPEKNLCGAGVAFKLVHALVRDLGWPDEKLGRLAESLLKLVAVATVADVVPLTGENRIIVKRGLEGFHTVRNSGLRALLRLAGLKEGECPSAGQVAFRIAPRINAAGRMASATDVIEMFLTSDETRANALAEQLHEFNKERQDTEADIVRLIADECCRAPVTDGDTALVFSGRDWHKGVAGIVASRVVERYHRPVFVLSEDEELGVASGSGRSISQFHLLEALESMPDLFTKFGGHRQAAGVTLPLDRVDEFRRRLNQWAAARLTPDDFIPILEIDAVIGLPELNDSTCSQVLRLAPFGFGNSAPLFAVLDAEIAGPPNIRSERMITVPLRHGGRTLFATAWGWNDRLEELKQGRRVNAALALEEDSRSAYGNWRIILKDVQPSMNAAVA